MTHEEELSHHGVKGMHWGTHKAKAMHPSYTSSQQEADRKEFGNGGVRRINKRLNYGMTRAQAKQKESNREFATAAIGVGASVAALLLAQHGDRIAISLANERAARTTEFINNVNGVKGGLGYIRKAKKKRGAYKITSL